MQVNNLTGWQNHTTAFSHVLCASAPAAVCLITHQQASLEAPPGVYVETLTTLISLMIN